MMDLSRKCAECGNALMFHTMYFEPFPFDVDKTQPLKCPLGQLSNWISWDDALRED